MKEREFSANGSSDWARIRDARRLPAVDRDTLAWGHLFFESPKGRFEPGIYTLVIENKVAHVRLPLALGIEGTLERTK